MIDPKNKDIARQLYIDGLTLSEIADRLDVNIKTVSSWKKDNKTDWEKLRAIHSQSTIEHRSMQLLDEIVNYTYEAMTAINASTDVEVWAKVDSVSRLMQSYQKGVESCQSLMPEINQNQVINRVITDLSELIAKEKPSILNDFLIVAEKYVNEG